MGNIRRDRHGQIKDSKISAVRQGKKNSAPFLVPLLYLHVGRNFGIRSLSLSSLSLKSMGPSTVTQHGGVQKMSTRKNMFPKLRKRKRRELQKQRKCCKTALPTHYLCHLQRIWMDFSYRESTILTVYTVRTAQTGTISIQVIQ